MQFKASKFLPIGAAGMHPLTLEFDSPELEGRFRVDYTQRSLPIIRIALLAGGIQYLMFYFLDLLVITLPQQVEVTYLLAIRLVVFAFILGIFFWSFRDSFRRYFDLALSATPLIGAIGILGMVYMVQNNHGYDQYHVGIMIIFFYIHVLLRMRFIYATTTGWIIYLLYLAVTFPADNPSQILINSSFFLISSQLCGMFASYSLEYYARLVFRQSKDLEERRRQIKQQHDSKATELRNLRDIQLSLLPGKSPSFPGYEISAGMKTATEVGGDFYDFAMCRDGSLTFVIGDATGHGPKAGALVTAVKVLFVSMAGRKNLVSIVKQASKVIAATGLKQLYMSLAIGRLQNNTVELVGAGMPPALIWRQATENVESVPLNGMPLGTLADYPYHIITVKLDPGDMLFLMSDGLPELFNDRDEMYGYETPAQVLKRFGSMNASSFIEAVEREIENYKGIATLHDDISLIALKKVGVSEPQPELITVSSVQTV